MTAVGVVLPVEAIAGFVTIVALLVVMFVVALVTTRVGLARQRYETAEAFGLNRMRNKSEQGVSGWFEREAKSETLRQDPLTQDLAQVLGDELSSSSGGTLGQYVQSPFAHPEQEPWQQPYPQVERPSRNVETGPSWGPPPPSGPTMAQPTPAQPEGSPNLAAAPSGPDFDYDAPEERQAPRPNFHQPPAMPRFSLEQPEWENDER